MVEGVCKATNKGIKLGCNVFTQELLDEVNEYLALTDDQLAGYGLERSNLEYRKAQLEQELVEELKD